MNRTPNRNTTVHVVIFLAVFFFLAIITEGKPRPVITRCDIKLAPDWAVANIYFTSLYSFTVDAKGRVTNVREVRDLIVPVKDVRACLADWRFKGFPENSEFTVYFEWNHKWVRQEVSGVGFKRIVPM